jgi:guanosine-3',5'-bis(diphosphate) 3'-pyrophosphohydrolase
MTSQPAICGATCTGRPRPSVNTVSRSNACGLHPQCAGGAGPGLHHYRRGGGNILNLKMTPPQGRLLRRVDFEVEVKDAKHATTIAAALRANPSVETVERLKG